jgi:DNA-binding MarR family transcriptional regulator
MNAAGRTMTEAIRPAQDGDSILNSFRRIVRAISRFNKDTRARIGLSTAQLFVLQQLQDGNPVGLKELARRASTDAATVAAITEKLEQKNLVQRRRSVTDLRVREIWLSPGGKILLHQAPDTPQSRLLRGISKLEPKTRESLGRVLRQLVKESGLEGESPAMFLEAESDDPLPNPASGEWFGSGQTAENAAGTKP